MRLFFRRTIPPFSRILVVESGSRSLLEDLLPGLYEQYGEMALDLVTCYTGAPEAFRSDRGRVYRVTEYPGSSARKQLYKELESNRYSIAGIICSNEQIMTKWKWMLAVRLRAKVFVLNENGDYFWLDYSNWQVMRHFMLYRAGLAGAGAVRTLARVFLFPFTLIYLMLYTAAVHLQRKVRA